MLVPDLCLVINFGTDVAEKVRSEKVLYFPPDLKIVLLYILQGKEETWKFHLFT